MDNPTGQNRVLIGLPERLQKAQAAVAKLEQELRISEARLTAIRLLVRNRASYENDTDLGDHLSELYDYWDSSDASH